MKQQPFFTTENDSSSKDNARRTWPDTYLSMAPCLVAVLALSGAARSGAAPQEKQPASATATTTAAPQTRITGEAQQTAATSPIAVPARVTSPYTYGNGDLRALPVTFNQNTTAEVSNATLGLPEASKIITVTDLQLPPASKPLPGWMQKAVVSADTPNINESDLKQAGAGKDALERFAQAPSTKPAWAVSSTTPAPLPNQITVAASTYVVLVANTDLQTVAVADPTIADVSVVNSRAVLVNGKSAGNTTLVIVDKVGKIRQYDVHVTPAAGARPEDIESAIGIEGIHVRQLRDTIVLEGQVDNNDQIQQAVEIAGIYAPKVLNLLQVQGAMSGPAGTAAQIQKAINLPDVQVSMLSGTAVLQGTVQTPAERAQAEQVASVLAPKVLNLLQLPVLTVDQIKAALGAVDQAPVLESTGDGTYGTLAPQPYLVVHQFGDQLVLEGYEPADYDVNSALQTAARSGLQIVDHIRLAPAGGTDQQLLNTVAAAIGMPGVHVRGTAKRIVLEGTVPDTNAALAAGQIALGYATQVDNMLQTPNPIQVNVDVSMVEISKTGMKELGVNAPSLFDSSTGFSGGLSLGSIGIGSGQATTLGSQLGLQLRAAIDKGEAHMLSNPRSTVLSGRTASFVAGGQIPIPASISQGTTGTLVQVEYKNYGVMMDITPIADKAGTVTMRVHTDVTQIDPSYPAQVIATGFSVPAFTTRTATTEVTVPPGGSIALSGLIQNSLNKYVREVPLLSKIPILGKLFSSTEYQNNESDLVIFVTPHVLPNSLPEGSLAPAAVTVMGPNTTAAVTLGNSGIKNTSSLNQGGDSNGGGSNGGGSNGGGSTP